ncbi:hypothetical protein QN277_002399 [Acacia crassicarpa]|uniref:Uncharacterized protein n=1 Tax=Acacia crassicarpa TaxID=499986 RepID=A0AAE1NAE6_9FABA|nr:hypothetical protein QN277_002399 [Acacia crassicarpa]
MQVERKIDLVYGGGSIGLMGLVSQAVFDGGLRSDPQDPYAKRDHWGDSRRSSTLIKDAPA